MFLKILMSLMVVALLAGCATPQTRARDHAGLMAELSPEERELVESGQVDLGFSKEMVYVALGEPDRKYHERTTEGESTIWAYHRGRGLSGLSFGVGTGIGVGGGGSSVGGGVSVGTGRGHVREEERLRVIFSEERVIGIERAEE